METKHFCGSIVGVSHFHESKLFHGSLPGVGYSHGSKHVYGSIVGVSHLHGSKHFYGSLVGANYFLHGSNTSSAEAFRMSTTSIDANTSMVASWVSTSSIWESPRVLITSVQLFDMFTLLLYMAVLRYFVLPWKCSIFWMFPWKCSVEATSLPRRRHCLYFHGSRSRHFQRSENNSWI